MSLHTIYDASRILKMSDWHLRKLIKEGQIKTVLVERSMLEGKRHVPQLVVNAIERREIDRFIEEQRNA